MKASPTASSFPPFPASFRGRTRETRELVRLIRAQHPTVLALVGGGGSGKTTLVAALGHRLSAFFGGRLTWLRIGGWDRSTVEKLIATQLGAFGEGSPIDRIRRVLGGRGRSLVVLDNHERDAVTAEVLSDLAGLDVTWIVTARRCLLGGVTLFPVVPALISVRENPFPRIASLTRMLRWHPVALDIANALVEGNEVNERELGRRLEARGVTKIVPIEHEDDVPEVAAVVAEAVKRISAAALRMLAVLVFMGGDSMDARTLGQLAKSRRPTDDLAALVRLRLVQTPSEGRFTLHATVRHALEKTARFDVDRYALHFIQLFEREPERVLTEQTHLFALMDWAQDRRDLSTILRVQALAERLDALEIEGNGESTGARR